jgi:hypothetical protein
MEISDHEKLTWEFSLYDALDVYGGGPASWIVIEDVTAPSGGKVLAQTSTDKASFRFPLCVYDGF